MDQIRRAHAWIARPSPGFGSRVCVAGPILIQMAMTGQRTPPVESTPDLDASRHRPRFGWPPSPSGISRDTVVSNAGAGR